MRPVEPGNNGDEHEPTEDELDERFVLNGDPVHALRDLLNKPADDEQATEERVP